MSDSSGESEDMGFLVQESDQESTDYGPDYLDALPPNPFNEIEDRLLDTQDGDSDDSDLDEDGNGFLDLEAADSDDSDSASDGYDSQSNASELDFFPQFKRLPLELRYRIWEFFCPDLTAKSRLYYLVFMVDGLNRAGEEDNLQIWPGPHLEEQTRPTRALMAVHRESRQLALKAFPDTLRFERHAILRFKAKKDVILLDGVSFREGAFRKVPGFSEKIHHLAVTPPPVLDVRAERLFLRFLTNFENLETAYRASTGRNHRRADLRWCSSDQVNCYTIPRSEEQPGLGEDAEYRYCWPDIESHRSFAEKEIPIDRLHRDLRDYDSDTQPAPVGDMEIWPLIEFCDTRSLDKLRESGEPRGLTSGPPESDGDSDSSGSDEGESEPDEYESEGIDDSDISEDGSDNDSDLAVLENHNDDSSDGEEEGEDGSEDDSLAISGSSSAQRPMEMIDLTADDDQGAPRFSSPEESSSTARESDGSASDQPASRISRLKRPRGRVVESDSEDDAEEDAPRKRARTTIVISDDDDEEDERQKMRANWNRRARAVLSDDEGDEENEGVKMRPSRRSRAVLSEDDDDSDDSDASQSHDGGNGGAEWSGISSSDQDEEPAGGAAIARPLSLAEKLQLHRDRVPIPPSDDDDSDVEEMAGDDYDARAYADFQDDEEGNEISEEGDDDDGGLIMDDDEEEEEYDEY